MSHFLLDFSFRKGNQDSNIIYITCKLAFRCLRLQILWFLRTNQILERKEKQFPDRLPQDHKNGFASLIFVTWYSFPEVTEFKVSVFERRSAVFSKIPGRFNLPKKRSGRSEPLWITALQEMYDRLMYSFFYLLDYRCYQTKHNQKVESWLPWILTDSTRRGNLEVLPRSVGGSLNTLIVVIQTIAFIFIAIFMFQPMRHSAFLRCFFFFKSNSGANTELQTEPFTRIHRVDDSSSVNYN